MVHDLISKAVKNGKLTSREAITLAEALLLGAHHVKARGHTLRICLPAVSFASFADQSRHPKPEDCSPRLLEITP